MKCITITSFLAAVFSAVSAYSETGGMALTWRDCVVLTQKYNPGLVQAREEINKLNMKYLGSYSPMLPSVSATMDLSRSKTPVGPAGNSAGYGIGARQMIFDGFRAIYDMKQAGENLRAGYYRYSVWESDIFFAVRSAFIQLLRAKELVRISGEIFKIREHNYNLVQLRYSGGREHRGSLLTAKANFSEAVYAMEKATRDLDLSMNRLGSAIGLREHAAISVLGDFTLSGPFDATPDFTALVMENPILQEMIHLKESAGLNVKSSEAAFCPSVYGYLNAGKSGDNLSGARGQWSAGIEMSLPIFQGGERIVNTLYSRAEYKRMIAETEGVKNSVLYTLREKWNALQNSRDHVAVQLEFLGSSRERSRIARAEYSIGMINFNNWIIIEDALVRSLNAYLDARADLLIAEAEWMQAKGEIVRYEGR